MAKDTRIETREITMCEACHHFKDDDCAHGNARYWCSHPNGPGGKLTAEIITKRIIHEDCPLPETKI